MGLLTGMRRRRGERAARLAEADAAVTRARRAQAEAAARRPEVTAVVGRLREIRRQNHFAEIIGEVLRGGTG